MAELAQPNAERRLSQLGIAPASVTAVTKFIKRDTLAQPLWTNSYHARRAAFRTFVEFF